MGDARGGTELGPKSKTEWPGLNFDQQNVQALIFMQREPYQGGVHRVLNHGASDWVWCEGGLLGAKKPKKLSHRGSVLADKIWEASVLGRGNLGRAREA